MKPTQEQLDKARGHLEAALKQARSAPQPINSMVWLLDGLCRAGVELLSVPADDLDRTGGDPAR
jgi:hypothetical protein